MITCCFCSFAGGLWLRIISLRTVCNFHFKVDGGLLDLFLIANIFKSKRKANNSETLKLSILKNWENYYFHVKTIFLCLGFIKHTLIILFAAYS